MNNPIPFFSLKRQWDSIKHTIQPAIDQVMESQQFVGGPFVEEFEKQFATYTGANNAIACNSGTDALWLALQAFNIQPNSIVLTTPFSFIASSSEVAAHGAIPVFIDIDATYNMDPQKLAQWLDTYATKTNNQVIHKKSGHVISGIITVDIFGQCADYPAIKAIADMWNLWIIEDACQAVGASLGNKRAGTLGDISCFSLYPTKNLGVYGDGGVMTTNNSELAQTLLKLRNHGRKSHYNYECIGRNSRLDALQAVIATKKLPLLDAWNKRRREIAQIYTKHLSGLPFIKTPCNLNGFHVYHQYCVEVTDAHGTSLREALQTHLTAHHIGSNIFYPKALHQIPFLTPPQDLATNCSITERVVQNILALPIWPELTNQEVEHICSIIEKAPIMVTPQKKSCTCSCSH